MTTLGPNGQVSINSYSPNYRTGLSTSHDKSLQNVYSPTLHSRSIVAFNKMVVKMNNVQNNCNNYSLYVDVVI